MGEFVFKMVGSSRFCEFVPSGDQMYIYMVAPDTSNPVEVIEYIG